MNVLITMVSGFIGNNIYDYFKKNLVKLIGIDKKKITIIILKIF